MTRDEILKLEAGRDLDVLIAEKVMGWTDVQKESYRGMEFLAGISPSEGSRSFVQYYSTAILASFEVVEKLCNETGCDIVKVCKRDPELYGEWSCNFGRGFEAFGNTAPLAICRAALLAVIGETK